MFLYILLVTLFTILSLILALTILLQKGKGSIGIGSMGGGAQMLFGGSGGQDIFQKATWVMGGLFMLGSLALAMMKTASYHQLMYTQPIHSVPQQQAPQNP